MPWFGNERAILDHGPGSYSEQIQEKLNKSRIILKFYYYILKFNLMDLIRNLQIDF